MNSFLKYVVKAVFILFSILVARGIYEQGKAADACNAKGGVYVPQQFICVKELK